MTSPEALDAAREPQREPVRGEDLLGLVRDFLREVHGERGASIPVTPESRIDRDLGIDSLGRTEMILRVERAFRVRLPPQTLAEADTVGDLIAALEQSAPRLRTERAFAPAAATRPQVEAPIEAKTLVDVLEWHVARHPGRVHATLLEDEATVLGTLTYGELAQAARGLAAALVARDVVPGDRVALMLPTSIDFFVAFFAALYAGAVPVPIYPPARMAQLEEHMRRQAGILRNAGARCLITVPQALALGTFLRGEVDSLELVESVASLSASSNAARLPANIDADATAFIQYTSGSTGDPKGVVLSHANLLANIRAIGIAMGAKSSDVFVSWLPLYHDLGLVGAWFGCLYFAAALYIMSPLSFLRRPETWLWTLHRYRGTLSAAPNFAFELCLSKISDDDIAGLDLSSVRMVANGAEPVSVPTLRRFLARYAAYGFRPGAMAPAYGLAENTVGLTFPPLGRAPLIDRVDRESLTRRGIAEPAADDDPHPLEIVSCGQPLPGDEVRIVDPTGREVEERHEGRLEFRGPAATSGYFRNEAKTRELFHEGWLDSGDQAYMAGGEVYVTGRVKDIIIRAGQHIYPQEIEEAVGELPGFIKTGVAVFGVADPSSGTERTIVLAETAETDPQRRAALKARARDIASDVIGAPPDDIVLAPPQSVPKTSSGKIRRGAAKELYLADRVGAPRRAVPWQVARLFLAGLAPQARRLLHAAGTTLYAGWWWLIIGLTGTFAWIAVMLLPRLAWRWAAVRTLARAALAVLRVPVTVVGLEHVEPGNAVLTVNHASYVDGLILAAVLPGSPVFAAKKELAGQFFAGPFLRRLGTAFLERYDVTGSLADAALVTEIARRGGLLVFFPEGTFTRRAGLTNFYLGAFKVAADAGLPVVPGILRGTRSMLRADQWFPRWTSVDVQFAEPVRPSGTDFGSLLRLRDRVRAAILARCGEPDLSELAKPAAPV
jgi:1-acyl-sn-glycerol-3-phosphate acyltransferase